MTDVTPSRRSITPPKGAATTPRDAAEAARVQRSNRIAALQWAAIAIVLVVVFVAIAIAFGADGTGDVVTPFRHSG
jgi:t-SNARE complex subunit (syntaxin)